MFSYRTILRKGDMIMKECILTEADQEVGKGRNVFLQKQIKELANKGM